MNLKITTEDGDVIFTEDMVIDEGWVSFKSTDGKQYTWNALSQNLKIEVEPFY